MNLRSRFLLVFILAIFLWGQGRPDQQGVAEAPLPPEQVESYSALFLTRLSPDLRALAESGGDDLAMVTVIMQPGTHPGKYMQRYALSREVAGVQWAIGDIPASRLEKLASAPGVRAVISPETFQTTEAPGLDQLRNAPQRPSAEQARQWLLGGGEDVAQIRAEMGIWARQSRPASEITALDPGLLTRPLEIHGAPAAHTQATGEGVRVAIVDTGVDFGHPDLQGTQFRLTSGPYAGWPFAYDTVSGARYALDPGYAFDPGNQMEGYGYTRYAATLPVSAPSCNGATCTADLPFDLGDMQIHIQATWPDDSESGRYYYSLHPDYLLPYAAFEMGLGYIELSFGSPLMIVADRAVGGVYDTVYVDVNYDHQLGSLDETMTKDRPLAGADFNGDDVWDLSAGLLGWISDGAHHPPGVTTLYPEVVKAPVPEAGRLLVFVNDENGHGTNCAGQVAAQGVISDPARLGPRSIFLSGAVVQGIAPDAQVIAMQNGFELPLDSWTLTALGLDGLPQSGDEAQVVSNSWGASALIEDGWDEMSRFVSELNRTDAPQVSFLAATGNGGHGYGTVTSPGGGTIIDVGASTFYSDSTYFEDVAPAQFLYGDVQPWSNRGAGAQGDIAPDVLAVGAWGLGPNPLNYYYGNGQAAYDVFGGTSMSAPLAAGGMALIYQSFEESHGRWPTWIEARNLLLNGTDDLGYDAITQGAGNMRVDRSVAVALNQNVSVAPVQWTPGPAYTAYPAVLEAGASANGVFTLHNPTASSASVTVTGSQLKAVHVESFQVPYTYPRPTMPSIYPLYLEDLTHLIETIKPDLVRAEVILPFESFDSNEDYYLEHSWEVFFYNWTDLDGDGKLWEDLNHDGRVGAGEMDVDPLTNLSEYNRYASASPGGTTLQVEVGREALALGNQRGDGIFLCLDCSFCGESTPLQVRVTFYRDQPWPWLNLPAGPIEIPAGGAVDFQATLNVPPNTEPGSYQGMIRLELPTHTQTLPVLAHVAAEIGNLQFGQNVTTPDTPYENTRLGGGFDWRWRYESGDWRAFYFSVPGNSTGVNTRLVVDTHWNSLRTDVDSWVYGAAADEFSSVAPAFFGPTGMESIGGSLNTNITGGRFRRETATGYQREVVSAEVREGLGMLVLHNVLYGGDQFAEPLAGSIYRVQVSPSPSDLIAPVIALDPVRLSGSASFQFVSTGDIPDGLRVQAYGFSPRIELNDQPVNQDSPANVCDGSWIYNEFGGGLSLHGGLLDARLFGAEPEESDLDLYIFEDNGNGIFECGRDPLRFYSTAAGSEERVRVSFPQDGDYWVMVHGYDVPAGQGEFDITIRAVGGSEIALRNLPFGSVGAGDLVNFNAVYNAAYPFNESRVLEGVIFIGLPGVPDLLEVPLTLRPEILLSPKPALWFDQPTLADGKSTALTLTASNLGVLNETIQVTLNLPPELQYVSSSPEGLVYNAGPHTLTWSGTLPAGGKIMPEALLTPAPGSYSGPVTVSGEVRGVTSTQTWPVSAVIRLRQTLFFLPALFR